MKVLENVRWKRRPLIDFIDNVQNICNQISLEEYNINTIVVSVWLFFSGGEKFV